ncbi:MAG: rod-binding protein [Geopsychrobacter sp.]|nr:rod-binding protein [Geopsychrobacter sp.]
MKIDAQAGLLMSQALQKNLSSIDKDSQKTAQVAQDFEAIFVQQIFKGMRQTLPDGGLLPKGQAEEIFNDMQDMEAAKQLTAHGGIGLAEMMVEQMQKTK